MIAIIELLSLNASDEGIEKLKTNLLEIPNLTIQEVNLAISFDAARIRRTYKFRTADSIQLATCIYSKAELFITNDKRLKLFTKIPIKFLS